MELKQIDRVYTEEQWKIDFLYNALRVFLPCPRCNLLGYMGYTSASVSEYCMCKSCGFWQAVSGRPKQCPIFYHNCKADKAPLPKTGHPRKGYCYVSDEMATRADCEFCIDGADEKAKWPAELENPSDHTFLKNG